MKIAHLLDGTYAVIIMNHENQYNIKLLRSNKNIMIDKTDCYLLHNCFALEEAIAYKIYDKYNEMINKNCTAFQQAFALILECIIDACEYDPYVANCNKIVTNKLKKAFNLLKESGEDTTVRDPYIWSFVPERYRKIMLQTWNQYENGKI